MALRDMDKLQEIHKFYSSLGTVPGLNGELAKSVAAAQARLDRNYVDSFTRFVEVLRKALVAMFVAKLSDAERADKLSKLFRSITSPVFKRKVAEASDLASEALEIDVQEKRAHDTVWKKRGTVLTRIKHVLREIDTEVAAIVEARDEAEENAPVPLRAAAYRVTSK